MLKSEQKKLRKAMRLLQRDMGVGWNAGMKMLAELAGMDMALSEMLERTTPVSIEEMAGRPDQAFEVKLPRRLDR